MTSHSTDPDLERAAASLQAELDKQTGRFRRPVARRAFERAGEPSDPAFVVLASAVSGHAVFVGDFTVDAAPGVVLRAGVLRDGFTLALVVAPPGRAPYLELTTFLARPPRLEREVVTTNGRADAPAPRPGGPRVEHRPELDPEALRARHLERLAELSRAGDDAPVRLWIEPSVVGVQRAISDYLDAAGF